MKNLKKNLAILLLAASTSVAFGQNSTENKDYKRFPHMFVGIQGGGQITFTNYDQLKLITPTASVYFGSWFSPVVGTRLHFNGLWNKGGYDQNGLDFKYDYKYITTNVDLMLNLVNLFGKKNNYPMNVYLIGGVGLNYAWDNDDAFAQKSVMPLAWEDYRINHNVRVGAMLEWNFHKHWGLNLEVSANSLGDRYNSKINEKDDWSLTAQLGIAYKFGYKKKTSEETVLSAEVESLPTDSRELSLYEQMQGNVNSRMSVWMKRMKGESKTDYLARTSDEAIQAQRLEFTKQVSTEMASDRANQNAKDLRYNTASQQLGVQFTDMPTIMLNVPKDDLKEIKDVKDLKFTNTVYNLTPDNTYEVLYTEAINPVTGKKYTYVNTRNANSVQSEEGFIPLSAVHQEMINNQRLQAVADKVLQEAKEKNILSDNTTITCKTEMIPTTDGKANYKIGYSYTVKDGFSVTDDFAPGKYEAENSAASTAMLKIINQTMSKEFAEYFKAGNSVDINFKGSADASPINRTIAYNNKYGDIKDYDVKVNGKNQKMTVTKATGINSNEQLSLVRAVSVKNYLLKNSDALKNMKVNESYEVEVSSDEGSQFRRVAVDFLFHDAIK